MFQVKNKPIHPDYYEYPYEDGELMAESTTQLDWIMTTKGNLDYITRGQDIFVAADLLWYPVQGRKDVCKAPDVMVAIGRPKGARLSYLQWHEDNIAPQVVFEILSKSNRRRRNKEELVEFYTKHGVEEYYSYDPVSNVFVVFVRQGNELIRLEGLPKWTSPALKIRFEWNEVTLQIFDPEGQPFLSFDEIKTRAKYQQMEFEEERLIQEKKLKFMMEQENIAWKELEAEKRKTQAEAQRAEAEAQRAEAEAQRAEAEAQRAETAEARQKLFEEKLRALGIDPASL